MSRFEERIARVEKVNEFIRTAAQLGRRFFYHAPSWRVSQFKLDDRGRLWWHDSYHPENPIFTHYVGRWKYFTLGGTMRNLIENMREYIMHNTPLDPSLLGIEGFDPDPWQYGPDMQQVQAKARQLQITRPQRAPKREEV